MNKNIFQTKKLNPRVFTKSDRRLFQYYRSNTALKNTFVLLELKDHLYRADLIRFEPGRLLLLRLDSLCLQSESKTTDTIFDM